MTLDPATGVWSIAGEAAWKNKFYLFEVEVYVHATARWSTTWSRTPIPSAWP